MTEQEKMLAGELYDCGDTELLVQWHKAKDLIRDYNQTNSDDSEKKERILSELLGGKEKTKYLINKYLDARYQHLMNDKDFYNCIPEHT